MGEPRCNPFGGRLSSADRRSAVGRRPEAAGSKRELIPKSDPGAQHVGVRYTVNAYRSRHLCFETRIDHCGRVRGRWIRCQNARCPSELAKVPTES